MRRVLVIERSLETIAAARSALESRGFEVEIAMHGGTGIEIVTSRRIDAVLLGLDGLEVSGEDLLQRVKESKPGIPILVTGDTVDALRTAGQLDDRVESYLPKPLDGELFLAELERIATLLVG